MAAIAALAAPAQAAFFKDAQIEVAWQADKPTEMARLLRERLAAAPADPQTVLLQALLSLEANDAATRKDVITRAEACQKAQPQAAECHYALGVVLGVQALSEGMLKAARSVGTIRDALTQAVTLEPAWFPARSALVQFYLEAPGMLGGSSSKALEWAQAAPKPEQTRALQARIAIKDGKGDTALVALTPLLASSDAALADDARQWAEQAAHKLINDGEAARSQAFFERLIRERPGHAAGPYGMGRVKAETGAVDEALKWFEQATALKGADGYPIDYRRGLALQKLGRLDAAKVAYTRFVDAGRGRKSQLDEARKRLADIGG